MTRLLRWYRLRGTETWRQVKPWPKQSGWLATYEPHRYRWDGRLWARVRGDLNPRPPLGKGW